MCVMPFEGVKSVEPRGPGTRTAGLLLLQPACHYDWSMDQSTEHTPPPAALTACGRQTPPSPPGCASAGWCCSHCCCPLPLLLRRWSHPWLLLLCWLPGGRCQRLLWAP